MRRAHPNRYRVQERGKSKAKKRCKHFRRPKIRYTDGDKASIAGQEMADKYQQIFGIWRCHCEHWHVGRPRPEDFDNPLVTIHYPRRRERPEEEEE